MNETSNKRAIWVGLFIFLGLVFLMAGILMVGNLHETFKRKMKLVAIFDNINGLQKGDNVWFSGVKIGTVGEIVIDPQMKVSVDLNVNKNAQSYLRKNVKVKLSSDGFIGNKVIVLYGGTKESPAIEEGDTLMVENHSITENLMNTLQKNNENLLAITNDFKKISKKLSNNEGTIGKLLNDDALYNNLTSITFSLNDASANASKLVGSLNQFSAKLNNKG